jgi:hypothetical protein
MHQAGCQHKSGTYRVFAAGSRIFRSHSFCLSPDWQRRRAAAEKSANLGKLFLDFHKTATKIVVPVDLLLPGPGNHNRFIRLGFATRCVQGV